MTNAVQLLIHNEMIDRLTALGNSKRGVKELCSDLINEAGRDKKTINRIADGCFLSPATVERMATLQECETGAPYRPNEDTCNRILRYFGVELQAKHVTIKSKYRNKPKGE